MQSFLRESEAEARSLGIRHEFVPVRSPDELEEAFAVMAKAQAEAMLVLPSSMLFGQYRRIVELAGASRLPAVYQARESLEQQAHSRPCHRGGYGLPAALGRCREPTPITPHYAPFATYKTAGGSAACSLLALAPTRATLINESGLSFSLVERPKQAQA